VLGDDVTVVFFAGAAEEFEDDDEEDHADAGAGEGAVGSDAPRAGDEAWVGVSGCVIEGAGVQEAGV
jgi:hypothetical protein